MVGVTTTGLGVTEVSHQGSKEAIRVTRCEDRTLAWLQEVPAVPKRSRRCESVGAGEGGSNPPTPERGTQDEAKPDGPGLGPHPYPTWGLLPVFVAYPLDDGPVAWRCKRAGGWGLAANVSRVRAGVADPLLQPGPTSQLGQSRVQGFQYFFDPSILVRLL